MVGSALLAARFRHFPVRRAASSESSVRGRRGPVDRRPRPGCSSRKP